MELPFYIVDAFTDRPFSGNPAAVCLLEQMLDDEVLQKIACEFNQAETAFVCSEGNQLRLRWFTPLCEVDLCGHATLAAAHALWHSGRIQADSICFQSLSGELISTRLNDIITLDFPKTELRPCITPPGLAEALGVMPFGACTAGKDLLVELGSADSVRGAQANMSLLAQLPIDRGIIICSEHDADDYDVICRFFAPKYGIPEDHVTGSAHCALAPYFSKRLKKDTLRSFQASARGGSVEMSVRGERVHIAGQACMFADGNLHF
jgi:PhzF family phenazine biosynthesis protein